MIYCWGMLNAPASGLAMAQLIAEGTVNIVDLTPFNPERPPSVHANAVFARGAG